ncbi:MAG: FHA domain-containing protein [Actinomycetia bacterium]|nr:FHA domain-containing protein [Actinomycetes bacterium]
MTNFDATPGGIHRGLGIVARWPGMVIVIPSDPAQDKTAEEILGSLGPEPTSAEVSRVIQNAIDTGQLRTAGYLIMAPGGPLAMLSGPVEVLADGNAVLSGAAGPVEQRIPATERITLRAANLAKATEPAAPFDLRRGIAPGAGITLGYVEAATNTRPATPPRPDHVRPEASSAPVAQPEVAVPFRSQPLFDQDIMVPVRDPLPVATYQQVDEAPHGAPSLEGYADEPRADLGSNLGLGEAMVHGILCSRSHFNNPSASYCMVCGISMVHLTHDLVPGPRPTLGYVVFDDGSTFGLDRSYLVGREPGNTGDTNTAPLSIQDNNETLSRRHAEIRLVDWTVTLVDLGSTNGSFIWDIANECWNQLAAERPVQLVPGDTIALGRRTFVFESVTGL